MKCCIVLQFIWVFTVYKSTRLGVSQIQSVKRFEYPLCICSILYFRTVQFSSPSLVNQTFLGFLVEHIQTSMLQIAQENNPPQLIQYIMAVSNLLNEESRIQSTDNTELADRIATRDLLAKFLDGLPANTITNIQQLASALQALTVSLQTVSWFNFCLI